MELMLKMPKKKNTFTGRFTVNMDEFEVLKSLVGTGCVRLIFTDKLVKTIKVEQWMIDHAVPRNVGIEEYMLVTYSQSRRQNDLISAKKFGTSFFVGEE